MRRSEFFNRQFPAPTDSFVYPFFAQYKAILKDVVNNWKADVVNGQLRNRDFIDLRDCRIDFKGNPENGYTPVISLVPLVGQETMAELAFYKRFLDTYVTFRNDAIRLITYSISGQEDADYDEKELSDKQRYNEHSQLKSAINRFIMLLKCMVTAMAKDKLEMVHLDILNGVFPVGENTLDEMFKDMGIAGYISNKFERGGHFYDDPDPELVQAFWNYAGSLHTFNTRGPENLDPEQWRDPDDAPELGDDFFENAEIRQGDKVIREATSKVDAAVDQTLREAHLKSVVKRTTPRAMTLEDIEKMRDADSAVIKDAVEKYIGLNTVGKRDPSSFKTLDAFLDEEGIKDEVTAAAQARVEQLKKDPSS